MNILYITGNIEEKNGGPGTSTRLLCEEFSKLDNSVTLLTMDVDRDYLKNIQSQHTFEIVSLKSFLKKALWGGFGLNYPLYLIKNIRKFDTIIINDFWGFKDLILMLLVITLKLKKKILIAPRGCLDSYVYNNYKKKLYTKFIQAPLIKYSNSDLYALSEYEKSSILNALGSIKVPNIVVAPNGIFDLNIKLEKPEIIKKKYSLSNFNKVYSYIGRFHEKKNIENTILGFKEFSKNNSNEVLLLFGNENNLYNKLKRKYESNNIKFLGYIKGDDKFNILSITNVFILASYSEGIPMAVLEAIGTKCKVLISKECNIDNIEKFNIGLYTKHDSNDIALNLEKIQKIIKPSSENIESILDYYNWQKTALTLMQHILRKD